LSNLSASKMRNKTPTFLKQVFTVIVTMVKAKTMTLRNKASAMKTRLLLFRLLQSKKILMSAISRKIHALMGHEISQSTKENSKAIVVCNAEKDEAPPSLPYIEAAVSDEDDDYPDLRHSLFDEDDDDELANGTDSVIDLVRNTREDGSDFNLEDEIDHVADLFIKRFHRQMKMQRLESLKRYQEMLERSV